MQQIVAQPVNRSAKISLEAGNSPRMMFSNYRELVRAADVEKWFGITPKGVEAVKAARRSPWSSRGGKARSAPSCGVG